MKLTKIKNISFKTYFRNGRINILGGWKLVLCFFVFLLAVIFSLEAYVFLKYRAEVAREVFPGEPEHLRIKKETLQEVMDMINMRKEEFQKNLIPLDIKDPSL
jgi:hypothetical protein